MTIVSSRAQLGFENAWVFLSLFVVGIGLLFGLSALSDLNDDIQTDLDLSPEAKEFAEQTAGNSPSIFDNLFLFLVIGLWGVLLGGAYASSSNPILTFIAIILGVIGLIVVMLVGNAYQEVAVDEEVSTFSENFPKMTWILDNILILAVFITFSVLLVLYAANN